MADPRHRGVRPRGGQRLPVRQRPRRLRARWQRPARMDVLDIGGPAMIRAAAKNHAHVGVVTDPADYDEVLAELRADGRLSDDLRRRLARKAFAFTAAYDAGIVAWFDEQADEPRPETLHLTYRREPVALRYGENPHQAASLYRSAAADPWWANVEVHGGMALSYLNLFDADAAWLLAHDLRAATGRPAVAIIKHANPCGAAVRRRPGRRLPAGLRLRPPLRVRRHRRPVRRGRRGDGRGHGRRRPGRPRHRPRLRRRRHRGAAGQAQEHPGAPGAAAHARRPPHPAHHRGAAGAGPPLVSSPGPRTGGSSPSAAHRGRAGRRRAWPGGSAAT